MSRLDKKALRNAFGKYPTGVTVVTTRDASGDPVGFTANSFTSVSLDPPLLLVCPALALSCYPVFEQCQSFTINILAEGQEAVSNTFAGFKGDRFAEVDWCADVNDSPRLTSAATYFSCCRHQLEIAGDHAILIGEVLDFGCSGEAALGYAGGQYFNLGLEHQSENGRFRQGKNLVGAIIEYEDQILLTRRGDLYDLPHTQLDHSLGLRAALGDWLNRQGFQLSLGNTYSIFEDTADGSRLAFYRAVAADDRCHELGRYYPIKDLPGMKFATAAMQSMLERFAFEHQSRSFGLYLGDEREGDLYQYHPGY